MSASTQSRRAVVQPHHLWGSASDTKTTYIPSSAWRKGEEVHSGFAFSPLHSGQEWPKHQGSCFFQWAVVNKPNCVGQGHRQGQQHPNPTGVCVAGQDSGK